MLHATKTPIVSTQQMIHIEQKCLDLGLTPDILMENAGHSCAYALTEQLGLYQGRILVIAGPGNNGGDGLAAARYLKNFGYHIEVFSFASTPKSAHLLQKNLALASKLTIQTDLELCIRTVADLASTDLILDALFGTGITAPLYGPWSQLIAAMNKSSAQKISIDIPSGLPADFGLLPSLPTFDLFQNNIVRATTTLALEFPKIACMNTPGNLYCGEIKPIPIGIPAYFYPENAPLLIKSDCLTPFFEIPPKDSHKGAMGHLLVIAGSMGKSGAAHLTLHAAQTVGVGLLTAALPQDLFSAVQHAMFSAMTLSYDQTLLAKPQTSITLGNLWAQLSQSRTATAIGPGLAPCPNLGFAVEQFLQQTNTPTVVDAEGLNALSSIVAPQSFTTPLVLTPHPKEAARLLETSVEKIQHARVYHAMQLSSKWNATVVLKGACSVIASPHEMSICPTGNPSMATGGMGDVLTGIIGALLARGITPHHAACMAAYWHGLSGDLIAKQSFPYRLIPPEQLIDQLIKAKPF